MLAGASVTSEWFHSGSLAFGGVTDSSARGGVRVWVRGVWRARRCGGARSSQGKSIDIQLTEAGILEWPSHAGFLGSATVWPHSFHQMSVSGKAPRIVSAATLRLL